MKEKLTTAEQPREAPVRVWRPKSEVVVPNKNLDQDADRFICVSYKKRHSPTKYIYDFNWGVYIYVSQIKRRPQVCVIEAKRRPHGHVSEDKLGP